ncbi:MAG: TOBE domain-containing protein, partial [Gammaproteobacteria bacterium]|nr:TOBE domain-containing protein [Gammaproteobacteria bacterium]
NLMPARIEDGRFYVDGREGIELPPHLSQVAPGHYTLGLRPHHLFASDRGQGSVSLVGEVEVAEVAGSVTYIHVDVNNRDWVVLERGVHTVHPGARFEVHFHRRHLYVFDQQDRLVASPDSELGQ